jgi:hypothetical protein
MTQLIAFEIYRTEVLVLNGERFTVRFSKRKDAEEFALFAVNDAGTKSCNGFYSPETAADFMASTGQRLEDEVYKVLKGDIERGHVEKHTRS